MLPKNRAPTHPGEILLEEFLKPLDVSQTELARKLGVPVQRINTLIAGSRNVSPETALLLSAAFETSAEFWMNLQTSYDLWHAHKALQKTKVNLSKASKLLRVKRSTKKAATSGKSSAPARKAAGG